MVFRQLAFECGLAGACAETDAHARTGGGLPSAALIVRCVVFPAGGLKSPRAAGSFPFAIGARP